MRNRTVVISGALVFLCSALAVEGAHWLKWRDADDPFSQIRDCALKLVPRIPRDSPVALRAVGLSDDCFHYLRYCVIPRPLDLKMPRAQRVLLLSPTVLSKAAADRLAYERPDLQLQAQTRSGALSLALYQAAL